MIPAAVKAEELILPVGDVQATADVDVEYYSSVLTTKRRR